MVCQIHDACVGVEKVEGFWGLSLMLCLSGRLCEHLYRAGAQSGQLLVYARPLCCL